MAVVRTYRQTTTDRFLSTSLSMDAVSSVDKKTPPINLLIGLSKFIGGY